jgi:hypothetical protein
MQSWAAEELRYTTLTIQPPMPRLKEPGLATAGGLG